MLPVGVEELTRRGHKVLIEAGAGTGSGLPDSDYVQAGAELNRRPKRNLRAGRHDRKGEGTAGH